MRHNAVRDYIRDKAALVYNDVEKEAKLKPVEEQMLNPGAIITAKARSDVRVMGFTRDFQNTHFDVKVINAQAVSHLKHNPRKALIDAEEGKDSSYKERIEKVEGATFIPMIFTSRGAKTKRTTKALAKIVAKIAKKRGRENSVVAKSISTDLSFILLKMELACIRGHRQKRTTNYNNN